MTLDEAIKHIEHKIKEMDDPCCKEDHKQLAEWLKELRELRMTRKTTYDEKFRSYRDNDHASVAQVGRAGD